MGFRIKTRVIIFQPEFNQSVGVCEWQGKKSRTKQMMARIVHRSIRSLYREKLLSQDTVSYWAESDGKRI